MDSFGGITSHGGWQACRWNGGFLKINDKNLVVGDVGHALWRRYEHTRASFAFT
jgi:hypothetical protein